MNDLAGIHLKTVYYSYAGSVIYFMVRDAAGTESIGSGFHIGSGIYITARHVLDQQNVVEIGHNGTPIEGINVVATFFHPNEQIDIAAVRLSKAVGPPVPLGGHFDDWINDRQFVLTDVLVLGYPPIPFANKPVLVATHGHICAVMDPYGQTKSHPRFVLSMTPRGGFSGGPALVPWGTGVVLGVLIQSLTRNEMPTENGFFAAVTIEPIFDCLVHHKIMPREQKDGWGDNWMFGEDCFLPQQTSGAL